jgi:hypothetical protein
MRQTGGNGNNRDEGRIITYVPRYEADSFFAGNGSPNSSSEMNRLQRAAYFYTDRIGLRHVAVLYLSLSYQGVIALLTGVHSMRYVPLLSSLPKDGPGGWVALVIYLLCGYLFQILLIFELAQVVWPRRPDRLRVRLESQSYWWLVWLSLLVLCLGFDVFLVGLSLTGATNFGEALAKASETNLTLVLNSFMMLLNFLTLLRCSMVMRTSTVEQNRQEIEEQLETIASEIMLEAGESTQEAAREVWRSLNINPSKFIPLQDSVLELVASQFPQFFPEGLGGDTWGYDFSSHSMVVLPPDLHQAFSAARGKTDRIKEPDLRQLLSLSPPDLAELIQYNLETYGKPRFVDASTPGEPPTFIFDAANLDVITRRDNPASPSTNPKLKLSGARLTSATANSDGTGVQNSAMSGSGGSSNQANRPGQSQTGERSVEEEAAATQQELWEALSTEDKLRFGPFLEQVVYPQLRGGRAFYAGAGIPVWEALSLVELRFFYEQWVQRGRPASTPKP